MTTNVEKVKTQQGALDVGSVQCRQLGSLTELTSISAPVWDWMSSGYLITPVPVECWSDVYSDGTVGSACDTKAVDMGRVSGGCLPTSLFRGVL